MAGLRDLAYPMYLIYDSFSFFEGLVLLDGSADGKLENIMNHVSIRHIGLFSGLS